MERQRLDKVIASSGKFSRREVKQLVRQGRILVDGAPACSGEEKVDPEAAEILVDGERLCYRRYTWVMLNKPAGVLSATEDGRGKTVLDLLPEELRRQSLFPVGRLDKDTEGLLLLTNEGRLAHDLLSPRHHVDKVYYARTSGCLTEEDRRAFAGGMTLGDGLQCLPAGLEILSTNRGYLLNLPTTFSRVFKVNHTDEELEEELCAIVDLGGCVENVMVRHRVYGRMEAPLHIRSRRNVASFLEDLKMGKSSPLKNITANYHYHTVTADSEETLDLIEDALRQRHFLVE